jgi:outer membrane immunogenic protein
MRRYSLMLVAPVVIGLAASQAASAADLPRKAPVYAPPPPPFSWTGFYIGIHAGYGWSNSTATVVDNFEFFDHVSLDQNGNGIIGGGQIG